MISIWAPRPGDEIIGCFYVLPQKLAPVKVYYGSIERNCARTAAYFSFNYQLFDDAVDTYATVYAPDPRVDMHPLHQKFGQLAQRMFREGKIRRLIHYTISMEASYIWEAPNSTSKRKALTYCYPEKSNLWEFDHRYFLFEGYFEMLRLTHSDIVQP